MFFALMLAAATAATTAPAAKPAPAPAAKPDGKAAAASLRLDLVPPFIGACMNPGPEAATIKAAVVKAGGKPAPQTPGSAPPAAGVEAYLFADKGVPFSVIFDKAGTCSVVAGRAEIQATRESLDRLVIGSSEVFDVSQNPPKPNVPGETIVVEYRLTSKNKKGGLQLTLSSITREQGTAVFLTRRIFAN